MPLHWIFACLSLLPLGAPVESQIVEGVTLEQVSLQANGMKLNGVLLRPTAPGRRPAVLCSHGFGGSADDVMEICSALARLGYVAMAVDFRGCGRSEGKPGFARGEVQDALAAIAYLRRHPSVDPKRVAAWGAGMGGMVALLAAAQDPSLKAAVGFMTPTDSATFVQALVDQKSPLAAPILKMVGGEPGKLPAEYRARSPLVVAKKIKAPVLLVYGEKDTLVPPDHGARMRWAMKQAGVVCTVKVYPGEGNTFASAVNAADAVLTMLRFLNEKLANKPAPGTAEACLLRRMELMQVLRQRQAAGKEVPKATLQICDLAEAALQAKKYPEAEYLMAEALAALAK